MRRIALLVVPCWLLLASAVSAQPASGRIDADGIRRVIRQNRVAFARCGTYRITLDFVIGTNGRAALRNVSGPRVTPRLESCLEKAVRSLRFPRTGANVPVRYEL